MDEGYRFALAVIHGEQDGGKFDWDKLKWKDPEK
jgi:hypothetical protein